MEVVMCLSFGMHECDIEVFAIAYPFQLVHTFMAESTPSSLRVGSLNMFR